MHIKKEFPQFVKTAGKITVTTAVVGLFVFLVAFAFDFGSNELSQVSAQTASTTLTVLNTPPEFMVNAYEAPESSTSTPTNSGDVVRWEAIALDSNGAPYFLLICETNASPTAASSTVGNPGTAAPSCATGVKQWGVSASASSGDMAFVSTTTTEGGQFSTSTPNTWFAWVCDDDPVNPRCNDYYAQGPTSTGAFGSSSPFFVNSRPILTGFWNTGPYDPGDMVTFNSTSTDSDVLLGGDNDDSIYLTVCSEVGWATTTNTCFNAADTLATTTVPLLSNTSATFTLPIPLHDDDYPAYAYIYDEFGHDGVGNGLSQDYTINNVAPYALDTEIVLNDGNDLLLTNPGGLTTGFSLNVKVTDDNGCWRWDSPVATSTEIKGFYASIMRNGSSTDCSATAQDYDPNSCYTNATHEVGWSVPTTTWALSCTATTTCTSDIQDNIDYRCDFPLWFVADPTYSTGSATGTIPAYLTSDYWTAGIEPFDNNYATGTLATTSSYLDVYPLTAVDVLSSAISYGALEPGDYNTSLSATSTIVTQGNTAIDQEAKGEAMCGTFFAGTGDEGDCTNSATSTVPEWRQQFSSTTESYDLDATITGLNLSPLIFQLSSTTYQELELDVKKATSTVLVSSGQTYWGILVPGTISLAGSYTGLNTFTAVTAEPEDWY